MGKAKQTQKNHVTSKVDHLEDGVLWRKLGQLFAHFFPVSCGIPNGQQTTRLLWPLNSYCNSPAHQDSLQVSE